MDESKKHFPTEQELDDAVAKAYAELAAAIGNYADKVRRRGWSQGWDTGWATGRKRLLEEFQSRSADKPSAPSAPPAPPAKVDAPRMTLLGTTGTASTNVLNYIERFPGQRGVEIAAALGVAFPERTVRTALHRLRNTKIKIVNGRWYTNEAAPTDSPESTKEED
ncbi:hypothetical protein [Bradyrhizobium sp. AZCC 2289]|uniref:hypothetical protein n=1 Tax=Bradyrhizobium sp. AZCC 2289 TaxID=3117026 RepID=UPI002FF38DF1